MTLPRYEPMLATPWPAAFSDPGWWFELKWDGVRVVGSWEGDRVVLRSRRGTDVTATYPEVAAARLDRPAVLDGEVVAFDDRGKPSFARLQQRMNLAAPGRAVAVTPVSLVVFDLLYLDGDRAADPIESRWEALASLALPPPLVATDRVGGDGEALFAAVVGEGLEGMVAKRMGSTYQPGKRSPDWRKVAHRRRVRAVVGGYLPGAGARSSTFASLLVGVWRDGGLRYAGAVGSGFDDRTLVAARAALDRIRRPASPFSSPVGIPEGAVWVEPRVVAEVEFKEWTPAGRLRAPVFQGFSEEPAEADPRN